MTVVCCVTCKWLLDIEVRGNKKGGNLAGFIALLTVCKLAIPPHGQVQSVR